MWGLLGGLTPHGEVVTKGILGGGTRGSSLAAMILIEEVQRMFTRRVIQQMVFNRWTTGNVLSSKS